MQTNDIQSDRDIRILAVIQLETVSREHPRQCRDGLHRRAPCGVEEGVAVFQQIAGDLALFVFRQVSLGSPSVAVAVEHRPAAVAVEFPELAWRIHLLEREAFLFKPGAKFRCRASHRQLVLAPVGHDIFWGLGWGFPSA